ncbi:MAG: T9SS type B sorting domain-containing protein, partial [Terrimonas sp.]|nr:T9SS type B sorting domain-containing protein [Terrimonas sp.]
PDAGQCALTASYSVTINPNITPTFSFGTSASFCAGASVPSLPNTSDNGITGTWSPATVDNQNSGTYIFTPTAGQCALTASYSVTINPNITPTFPFGTSASFCAGASVPSLPNTSDNGITGTWSPATVDNQNSGTYTFTPDAGQCATTATLTVTINPNITPTFPFGTSASFCAGASVPTLPNTSDNGITGTWSPAIIDNQNSGTYTFTPTAGQCATTTTLTVTINPILTPIFSFGTSASFCAGASVPALPNTSDNGISGTWSPATIDNQNSGTYTFTPDAGQCGTATSLSVTINPNAIPVFSFGPSLSICAGGAVPALPNISDNSINGSWSPAIVSNQTSGTYIFTGNAGQCVTPYTFTVTVNPIVTPSFSFGNFQSVCIGSAVPNLPTVSDNGISGTWSPAVADNQVSGTYVFTPTPGQCANSTQFTLEINPVPSVTVRGDTTVYDGDLLPVYNWMGTPGSVINWVNSNTDIGLPASGTGNLPSFTAINKGDNPISGTVIITPAINGCTGLAQSYKITVLPLDKDVFVPNVFSPNDDGKNDILYVYGNYIDKVDMHIYNQWGQEVATIKNKSQGWDGRHKGNPQPVGVYVYVLKAELSGGRTVQLKGSITLVR